MNEQLERAMTTLAICLSALFLLVGSFYLERADAPTRGAGLTRQADVRDGLDIRLISERDPYMRSER